jgi:hypothetical protein
VRHERSVRYVPEDYGYRSSYYDDGYYRRSYRSGYYERPYYRHRYYSDYYERPYRSYRYYDAGYSSYDSCYRGCVGLPTVAAAGSGAAGSATEPRNFCKIVRPGSSSGPFRYASTLAASALFWMNSRRGSTASPINSSNSTLASSTSLTRTCNSERASMSSVVSHNCSGFISPSPL